MSTRTFQKFCNDELLKDHEDEDGKPVTISVEAARLWLHKLGFGVLDRGRGVYIDGHDRSDVLEARSKFLDDMERLWWGRGYLYVGGEEADNLVDQGSARGGYVSHKKELEGGQRGTFVGSSVAVTEGDSGWMLTDDGTTKELKLRGDF